MSVNLIQKMIAPLLTIALSSIASSVLAIEPGSINQTKAPVSGVAIVVFFLFVAMTLLITVWASKRTESAEEFYAAGGKISGARNGVAIAGDFLSAAALLGQTGLVYLAGADVLVFCMGLTLGWGIVLFVIAEPLRRLGRFTFADAVSFRLAKVPIRLLASFSTLVICIPYLIAQMVGAGTLVQSMFGINYAAAVFLVGGLMVVYVVFGGMLATTWIQIVKAALLIGGTTLLSLLILMANDFSFVKLASAAVREHPMGQGIMGPGLLYSDPISMISLQLAFVCGIAGFPHLMMRFFTVPDARQARISAGVAISITGFFMILVFVIGLGAIAYLTNNPEYHGVDGKLIGGNNMVAIHLSKVLGGEYFYGFMAAVSFATILAVVSGLMMAAASTISHDLFATLWKKGKVNDKDEVRVFRIATLVLGLLSILLSLVFEGQNIAVMTVIATSIAASVNFPVLFLALYWRGFTTRGAIVGGLFGMISAVVLIILGPTVWVGVLGFESPIYPYAYPTLMSLSLAFVGAWLASVTDKSARATQENSRFLDQYVKSQFGDMLGSK